MSTHPAEKPGNESNPGIVILGAGGHAKVVIEIFRAAGETIAYCVANAMPVGGVVLGVPVVFGEDEPLVRLRSEGYFRAHVAIGANPIREKLCNRLKGLGFTLTSAIHPRSVLSPTATIGPGTAIMAGAVVNACTSIGEGAIVNTGATIDHDCKIGNYAHVAPQCGIAGTVSVGSLAFLGVGTKVIPGINIGDKTTTGAGAVVVRDLPGESLAVGVPARIVQKNKENHK